MFKKIEIWILYLTIILGLLFALSFGVLVRQETEGITKRGNIDISFISKPAADIARLPEKILISLIKTHPLRLNDDYEDDRYFYSQDGFDGTPNNTESYMLLSKFDGSINEGVVELVDLKTFEVLHTWNPDLNSFMELIDPDIVDLRFKHIKRDHNNSRALIKHPKLTHDGGLVFAWDTPLKKIDSCSNLIFQNPSTIFHHSIETDIEENIWVPGRLWPRSKAAETSGALLETQFLEDAIFQISPDGDTLYQKSLLEIFVDNGLEYLVFAHGNAYENDPFHLNDIQPVDKDGPYWKKGDLFLSIRNQSMVILYRPSSNEIIWKGAGPFFHQHDVDILDENRIAIFDNNSINVSNSQINIVDGGYNEVVIYDFSTNTYSSYLPESLKEHDVRTVSQGRSEILPNGDLFVEETNYGRTLYFNADGTLRWSHVNLSNDGNIYYVGWSRILYSQKDIQSVNNFLNNKGVCNE